MRQRKNEVWAASAGAVRHDQGEGAIPERKTVGVRTNRKPVPTRPEIYRSYAVGRVFLSVPSW